MSFWYFLSLLALVSSSCIIQSKFIPFLFFFNLQFVYFSYYCTSVSFAMFHPAIVTVCFSVIYLVSHIYLSSSSLTLHHDCLNPSVTNQTATSQFKSIYTILLSFILSFLRNHFRHTSNICKSIPILLSGDIQSNPGPISTHSRLNMCTLNIRSLANPLHYTALADLAESNNIHILP